MITHVILQIAMNCLGLEIEENPPHSNAGFWIEEFQALSDGHTGDAWCMFGVVWVYDKAFKIFMKQSPLKRTGWCYGQWQQCQNNSDVTVIPADEVADYEGEALQGGFWVRYDEQRKGHTGIVVSIRDGYMKSIEFNQSDGVRETRRKISEIDDFKGIIIPR